MNEYNFRKLRSLAKDAKKRTTINWLKDSNVLGVSFGKKTIGNKRTEELSIVVYVARKISKDRIPSSRLIPSVLYVGGDAIPVDVVETEPFYPISFTSNVRPMESGISGSVASLNGSGTMGALVTDLSDGSLCILSNNHVLADENLASIGDDCIQRGAGDGGSSLADTIAKLKKFQTIDPTITNRIDGAIAEVIDSTQVVNQMMNNLMPVPSARHPAVGLLFAGSSNRTILNPIKDVMKILNIEFLNGSNSITEPRLEANVEKVGRTTEYTSGTITEIDATVTINYSTFAATFDDQIVTNHMSCPGDSGSVVCIGGKGQVDGGPNCPSCLSSSVAQSIIKSDISEDLKIEKSFRDNKLSKTRAGNLLIETYFNNENYIVDRVNNVRNNAIIIKYINNTYKKHIKTFRSMASNPRSKKIITATHTKELQNAIKQFSEYLYADEKKAAEKALRLIKSFENKNMNQILELLNSEKYYLEVKKILTSVSRIYTN